MVVYTKSELEKAAKSGVSRITVKGQLAEEIKKAAKKKKSRKAAKIVGGSLAALGGLALIPFTGGASAAGVVAGASAIGGTALAVTALTISAEELAILVFGSVVMAGVLKGYDKISLNPDGSVTMENTKQIKAERSVGSDDYQQLDS